MALADETRKVPIQAVITENDRVIQTLVAKDPDYPFGIRTLPRKPRRWKRLFDTHGL